MPEAVDPMVSVGYLVAAAAVALGGLAAYSIALMQRLVAARAHRSALLDGRPQPNPLPEGEGEG